MTTIIVTHDHVKIIVFSILKYLWVKEEAFDLADIVVLFNHGFVEQIGTPKYIEDNPISPFAMNFFGDTNSVSSRSLVKFALTYKYEYHNILLIIIINYLKICF